MANWSDLKSAVASIIKTNGAQEITGQLLQNVLNNIISNVGLNSTFAGIATPETNPGTPDGNVFYLSTTAGTYSNFNGIVIKEGEAVILEWKGSWTKKSSGFATEEKLYELVQKSFINAKLFEGNGWGETLPYTMYPNSKYEFINIGKNPIIAYSAYVLDGSSIKFDGFSGNLNVGESVVIIPPLEVTSIRFYFNGFSSLLAREVIDVDKELLTQQNKINNLEQFTTKTFKVADTPFANADKMNQLSNYVPLAIKSVHIYVPSNQTRPQLNLQYLWKDIDGNWLIRISDGGERWKDWSKNDYVPINPSRDVIELNRDSITVRMVVDWESITAGSQWAYNLIFKEDCYFVQDGGKVINDVDGTMSEIIDGIVDAKYLAPNYESFLNNKFALAYLWKNYGDNKQCLIRVRMLSPNSNDNYANISDYDVPAEVREYTFGDGKFFFKIDWSKIPDGAWNCTGEFGNILYPVSDIPYDGYTTRDSTKRQVWVSQDGTKDYTSIGEAYAAITDSSYENQYEVVVLPGTYDEYNLIPPPFTHTYGLYPNSVKITSRNWANIGDTLPVFDQRTHPSKLSNLTIESWTGYCIHFDVEMNNVSIKNENLHLIKQYYEGTMMAIIGGGSYKYGTRYEWKSCIFECVGADGNVSCHTQANTRGDNTFLIFDSCSFVRCSPRVGSVGAYGKCTCEITKCNFGYGQIGLDSWFSPIRSVDNPNEYLANRMEWGIIGGGNKNFAPKALNTISTIRIKANYPIEISGSAVDSIFGNNYKTNDYHSARIQCSVTSMYYIDDSQAGLSGYSEVRDVYQLWKRLGDCSSINKTLSVTINGVTKSYTFNKNYLSSKQSEDSIIAEMQAVLSHCTIEKYTNDDIGYDFINTTDKMYIEVADEDVIVGEFITKDGKRATSATNPSNIAGMVVADTTQRNLAPVWTNAIYVGYMGYTGSGDIGLSDAGELYWTGKDKPIGFIKNRIFYPYY